MAESARAETAVKVQSCADAELAVFIHDLCQSNGWGNCVAPPTSQCWDFEPTTGLHDFGAWTMSGNAFMNQPTFGDNVTAARVLQTQASPLHPTSMRPATA